MKTTDVIVAVAGAQLRRRWRSLVAWAVGLAAVAAIYIGFWPAFEGDTLVVMTESLPEGLVEAMGYEAIGTPEGWLTSTVYGLLGPVVLLVFAISFGSRVVIEDERSGLLGLELAQPVERSAVILGRLAAGLVALIGLVVVVTVTSSLVVRIVGMDVATAKVVGAGVALGGFVAPWMVGAWALASITGRRGLATGVVSAAAVAAYVLHVLGTTLTNDGLARLSLYNWYVESEPVRNGTGAAGALFVVAIATALTAIAVLIFGRRDLTA